MVFSLLIVLLGDTQHVLGKMTILHSRQPLIFMSQYFFSYQEDDDGCGLYRHGTMHVDRPPSLVLD